MSKYRQFALGLAIVIGLLAFAYFFSARDAMAVIAQQKQEIVTANQNLTSAHQIVEQQSKLKSINQQLQAKAAEYSIDSDSELSGSLQSILTVLDQTGGRVIAINSADSNNEFTIRLSIRKRNLSPLLDSLAELPGNIYIRNFELEVTSRSRLELRIQFEVEQ